jgi:transposase
LLEKLLSYTVARRRQGAKLVEVATELGKQNQTLSRWLGEERAAKRFERVEVVAAPAASVASPILVHGPRGLRIEGLDIAAVAELVRRVGEQPTFGSASSDQQWSTDCRLRLRRAGGHAQELQHALSVW